MLSGAKKWWIAVAALLALGLLVIYGMIDPATHFFPRCPVLTITGYQCPGCGSQRAIHALLNGDIAAAWHYNAMLIIALPLVALLLAAELLRRKMSKFYNALNSRVLILTTLVVIVVWTVARNIYSL